jgi:hypothetical protein
VHGEHYRIVKSQRYDFSSALHPRALFGEDEFALGEITFRFREQNRDLQRECEVAVNILIQAIEVARHVLQQQRRWPRLTLVMTPF